MEVKILSREHGMAAVAEGSNADDEGDYRPGLIAVRELGVLGAFTGGFTAASGGICAALFFALIVALLGKPRDKNK